MNKTIKIGIVEDQVIIADTIIATLEDLGYTTTEPCMSYSQAVEMIEEDSPDLVLLDIQLVGKKTGIDVAARLNEKYNIPFIFLTSNADAATVELAKEQNPHAYLVKPFNQDDLFTAIEVALANFEKSKLLLESQIGKEKTIFLKKKELFYAVKFEDILYVKSDGNYIEIQTKVDTFLQRATLDAFIQKAPGSIFVRSHRRYIINKNYIETISNDTLSINGEVLPLSKTYKMEIFKLGNFL